MAATEELYDVVAVSRWTGRREIVARSKHREIAMAAVDLWSCRYPGRVLEIEPAVGEVWE